ncbi:hypothetical protein [Legionella sp. CNM-4043-24]|uniref:hypothetical protein n=1 Tax=Legionella sp. CNM-4043-24 TaxID=3421646 RepID=UPI00403B3092
MPRDTEADTKIIVEHLPTENLIQNMHALDQATDREKNILATLLRRESDEDRRAFVLNTVLKGERLYVLDEGLLSEELTESQEKEDKNNDSLLFGTDLIDDKTCSWVQIACFSPALSQQNRTMAHGHHDEDISDIESDELSTESLNIIRNTRLNKRLAEAQDDVNKMMRIARAAQKQAVSDPYKSKVITEFIKSTETLIELANRADTYPSMRNTNLFIRQLEDWNQSAQRFPVDDIKDLSFRSKIVAFLSGVVLGGVFAGIGFAIGGPAGAAAGAVIGAGLGWAVALTILTVKSNAISEQKRAEGQNPHRLFSSGGQKLAALVKHVPDQGITDEDADKQAPQPAP